MDVDAQADDMAARLQAQMGKSFFFTYCMLYIPCLTLAHMRPALVEDEAHTDEPDTNVELEAYRGVTFDDWAKLIVKVG